MEPRSAWGARARQVASLVISKREGERGAVLVLVALGFFVLFGAIGLGIDGARMFEERRAAQAAVDHAALASAHARCRGNSDAVAVAAGKAIAAANFYDDASPTISVDITAVVGPENTYLAHIVTTIEATFARAIGFDNFTIGVEATASGTGCDDGVDSPGAIYAGGSCPSGKYGVDVSGSNQEVYGGVHTNDTSNVGGSGNDFNDEAYLGDFYTYVETHNGGSGNSWEAPDFPDQVPMPSPVWAGGWDPSVITGGSGVPALGTFLRAYYDLADANGTTASNDTLFTSKVTSITKNGVYYTTHADGFDVSSVSGGVTNVVMVAPNGPIKVSVSSVTLNPFAHSALPRQGILMLSNYQQPSQIEKCDKYSIAISGSSSTWNGVLWASGGLVEFSGSSNSAVNGSAVGWAVRLNGSDLVIRHNASDWDDQPMVLLLK